jgi:hypothetical protein
MRAGVERLGRSSSPPVAQADKGAQTDPMELPEVEVIPEVPISAWRARHGVAAGRLTRMCFADTPSD